MNLQRRFNRIALLWLLLLAGFAVIPSRSMADCAMNAGKMASSAHDCCVKQTVCVCAPAASDLSRPASQPGKAQMGCTCTADPQPANPAPQAEPLRYYMAAALPMRAGPLFFTVSSSYAPCWTPDAACFIGYSPPSSPRAPPFKN